MRKGGAHAEKSADAVAAKVASEERRACQHAPLWPMKVPILTHVSKQVAPSQTERTEPTNPRSLHLVAWDCCLQTSSIMFAQC